MYVGFDDAVGQTVMFVTPAAPVLLLKFAVVKVEPDKPVKPPGFEPTNETLPKVPFVVVTLMFFIKQSPVTIPLQHLP